MVFKGGDKVVGESCCFAGDVRFFFRTLFKFSIQKREYLLRRLDHTDPAVVLLICHHLNYFFIKRYDMIHNMQGVRVRVRYHQSRICHDNMQQERLVSWCRDSL